MKKIVYGISGIGTGHTNRQTPIIEILSKKCHITLLVYLESYRICKERFKDNKNVEIIEIDVPFIYGDKDGLNFASTLSCKYNQNKDFSRLQWEILENLNKSIGKPDLVITDYEPISASYAYMHNSPIITIDQQSKYLFGKFPKKLSTQSIKDEVMRLRMFFPKVDQRLACSFFNVERRKTDFNEVKLVPPTIKNEILEIKRNPSKDNTSIIIYISSQREFIQSIQEIVNICSNEPDFEFDIFIKDKSEYRDDLPSNIKIFSHGNKEFYNILARCNGIISTAGHMLLSEAMYLGIPVYALPLEVFEQQMNAYVIDKNKFGISYPSIDHKKLRYFIENLSKFEQNIKKDNKVLQKKSGQKEIIKIIESILK